MVNTFLTHSDFKTSAQSLDRQRLGKQRVEAFQILNIIENLEHLSKLFQYPYDGSNLKQWIKDITTAYKNLPYLYVIRDNTTYTIPKDIVKQKSLIDQYLQPNDHIIKLGFSSHPIVVMWFGYTDALKSYINEHIDEWIHRGYNNNMNKYIINKSFDRPKWTYDQEFHKNHRSALLNKEITRKEKPWYQLKQEFLNSGEFIDYIWVDESIIIKE